MENVRNDYETIKITGNGKFTKICHPSMLSLKNCCSVVSKTIELRSTIDRFISDTHKDNPDANPFCIKRIVVNLLTEESARLYVELVMKYEEKKK